MWFLLGFLLGASFSSKYEPIEYNPNDTEMIVLGIFLGGLLLFAIIWNVICWYKEWLENKE